MEEDYIEEVRNLIKRYTKKQIRYAKPLDYLLWRNKISQEEIETELFSLDEVSKVVKQEVNGEKRYLLYFVYGKRRGRAYVVHFNEKITVITAYPLGKKTLSKYKKRRFIK